MFFSARHASEPRLADGAQLRWRHSEAPLFEVAVIDADERQARRVVFRMYSPASGGCADRVPDDLDKGHAERFKSTTETWPPCNVLPASPPCERA